MSKTKFPEAVEGFDFVGYPDEKVEAWIKRCKTDRPQIQSSYKNRWTRGGTGDELMSSYPKVPNHVDWVQWFDKWFGQFTFVTRKRIANDINR